MPEATTVNVAVAPSLTATLAGWVVMVGPTAVSGLIAKGVALELPAAIRSRSAERKNPFFRLKIDLVFRWRRSIPGALHWPKIASRVSCLDYGLRGGLAYFIAFRKLLGQGRVAGFFGIGRGGARV